MNSHPPRRVNLLVIHSDPILCAGLVAALRQNTGFEVFVSGSGHLSPGGVPADVIVADYESALRVADRQVRARVLAVTPNDREVDIRRAIEAGVHGYLLVGGPLNELTDGVVALANGLRYMSPAAAHRMADSLTRASLTSREIEVLRLIAEGHSNKLIARHLDIELGTVKSHVSAIMGKLGARCRTQAVGIAASRGLVEQCTEAELMRVPTRRPMEGAFQAA